MRTVMYEINGRRTSKYCEVAGQPHRTILVDVPKTDAPVSPKRAEMLKIKGFCK